MTLHEFDPFAMLHVLKARDTEFVVIGGLAGRAWGSPTITNDLDICYSRTNDNLTRLVAALGDLEVRLRGVTENVPFLLDEKTIRFGDWFTFETTSGKLDCLGTPSGTAGYPDLKAQATEIDLGEGLRVWIASLQDVIRMKRAAGRPKDRIEVEILSAVLQERERQGLS